MNVILVKRGDRHRMICERTDGSTDVAVLGPSFPYHDLAHYVAERTLGIEKGFYGNIAGGLSSEALSNDQVIRSLGPETWQAEVLARAVTSLATGACTSDQFPALVNDELIHLCIEPVGGLNAAIAETMLGEFRTLVEAYNALPDGESLRLVYEEG